MRSQHVLRAQKRCSVVYLAAYPVQYPIRSSVKVSCFLVGKGFIYCPSPNSLSEMREGVVPSSKIGQRNFLP